MKTLFTLLSLVLLLSAHAQTYMYVEDVVITPESPVSTSDEVYIQVLGNFSNPGAFIVDHNVSVDGFTVQLEINAGHDGGIHTDVLVPFDITFALGMHSPGEYTVEISGTAVGVFVDDPAKFNFVVEGGTDGIDEVDAIQIQVFPNPATNFLTVNYEDWQLNSSIQLYTIDSKLIQTKLIESGLTLVDLSSVDNGSYIIQILDPKGKAILTDQIVISK